MRHNAAVNESIDRQHVEAAGSTGLVLQNTYTLGACIGRGGTGEVYEATHVRLPGRVAVKILRADLLANEDAFARFCREAEIMSALRHPHTLQIFDFNTALDGRPYFVMEYLEGVDLETRLANSGALPLPALVRIVDAVASALGAAHAAGIIHRELKPANIFFMRGEGHPDDFVKVIDFGISKTAGSDPRQSGPPEVIGTPEFMAPEQALGLVDQIDARTDQFALAAVTYTMLTGRVPFVGNDPASLLHRVVHQRPLPLARFLPWDTKGIQSVLDRALAKRQQDRFDGIVQFARALGAAAHSVIHRETSAPAPVSPAPAPPVPMPPARLPRLDDRRQADLPRTLDRVPHGSQRTLALGLAVLGLAALIVHQGWYRGLAGRTANLARNLVSLARGERRAPPTDVQTSNPEATASVPAPLEGEPSQDLRPPAEVPTPPREPGADTVAVGDEILPYHAPASPSEEPLMAPDGFSIPEPKPSPPARDRTSAAAPSD